MPYSPRLFDNRIAYSHLDPNGSGRPGGGRGLFFLRLFRNIIQKLNQYAVLKPEIAPKLLSKAPGLFQNITL